MIAVLFVAIAMKFVGETQGNGFGFVLHLIGDGFEEIEVLCGPQADIQRVACTMVDSNNGYELRKYLESLVNFGVGFGVFFNNLFVNLYAYIFFFFCCLSEVVLCSYFLYRVTLRLGQTLCKLEFGFSKLGKHA